MTVEILAFIGPPAAGKSTAARKKYQEVKITKKAFLLWDYPANKERFLNTGDNIKALLVVSVVVLITFIFAPIHLFAQWRQYRIWLSRVFNEWHNCAIARRYINSLSYECCVNDGLLLNKFYLEFADPRNIVGEKLWPFALFF